MAVLPHPGSVFWLLFLPVWVLFVLLQAGLKDPSLTNFPPPLPPLESLWDPQAVGLVFLWILFQALLYVLPVGKVSSGSSIRVRTFVQRLPDTIRPSGADVLKNLQEQMFDFSEVVLSPADTELHRS